MASSSAFKYADTHEITSATLRHGCLQPQQTAASLQTLPHHYANFAGATATLTSSSRRSTVERGLLSHHEHEAVADTPLSGAEGEVPDIIQVQAASSSDSDEAGSSDRHVIVNQLLTFLTEKQQRQLIDLSEANTASTTSTLRLTDP